MKHVLAFISFTTVLGCGGRTGLVVDGDTVSGGSTEAGMMSEAGTYCAWMGGPVASCEATSPTDPAMLCPTSCAIPAADYGCWGCCQTQTPKDGACFFYPFPGAPTVVGTETCQ
jgi:hypothetical protein